MRTIALEEHFVTQDLAGYGASSAAIAPADIWERASRRLLDITGERVAMMDAAGLDMAVLSLNAPGIQAEPDPKVAVTAAARVNDYLAEVIAAQPGRFSGFAALPLQDGEAAAKELHRAVTQLGLRGAWLTRTPRGAISTTRRCGWSGHVPRTWTCRCTCTPPAAPTSRTSCPAIPSSSGRCGAGAPIPPAHALRLIFGGVFDDAARC